MIEVGNLTPQGPHRAGSFFLQSNTYLPRTTRMATLPKVQDVLVVGFGAVGAICELIALTRFRSSSSIFSKIP